LVRQHMINHVHLISIEGNSEKSSQLASFRSERNLRLSFPPHLSPRLVTAQLQYRPTAFNHSTSSSPRLSTRSCPSRLRPAMAEFSRLVVPKAPRTSTENVQKKESVYWKSFKVSLKPHPVAHHHLPLTSYSFCASPSLPSSSSPTPPYPTFNSPLLRLIAT
jgi:hypothetical protein